MPRESVPPVARPAGLPRSPSYKRAALGDRPSAPPNATPIVAAIAHAIKAAQTVCAISSNTAADVANLPNATAIAEGGGRYSNRNAPLRTANSQSSRNVSTPPMPLNETTRLTDVSRSNREFDGEGRETPAVLWC